MQLEQPVVFDHREATVLVDVLRWAHETDDLNEYVPGTLTYEDDVLPELIESLEDEHAFDAAQLDVHDLGKVMRAFASELEQQALDMENPSSIFEFYEKTFQSIQSEIQQHTTSTSHDRY